MRWLLVLLLAGGVHAQDLAGRIRSAQTAGNYSEAAELYSQLIASGADSAEIRSNYGIMLHLAGRNREAIQQFRAALQRKPDLASANLFAGLAELALNQPAPALPLLKRAQELDASHAAPYLALGKAYVALRRYLPAKDSYEKATALDPTLADAWYGLGVTRRSLADELLNRATRQTGPNEENRKEARLLLDQALQALSRAVELEPNGARAHLIMAESLSDSGKLTEAVQEYQTALRLEPHLEAATLGLASLYWKQRQFEQALPLVRGILSKSPKDPEANGILADILQHGGEDQEAVEHAETALAGNPDLIETRIVLARVYLGRHEPRLAVAELTKVIAADPDGSYHYLLYRAYHDAGSERAAQTALKEFERIRSRH